MKIGLSSGGPLTIDLVSSQASYFDATEKRFSGPFDEKLITAWLNANGFTDPLVAERAKDVLPLINEIPAGAGGNFTYAAQDPARGNMHLITAHPATPPFTVYQHFAWTKFIPLIVSSAAVLGGIPVVILLGKRIQSRENADQARAHP